MKLFENQIQELKYKVLREVAVQTWKGNDAFAEFNEIASKVVDKNQQSMRCCIYKDRAVIAERIRLAIGGSKKNKNVVQVIDIACDECPEAGYVVTDLCRGCLAHNCMSNCKLNAIEIDGDHRAHINKVKCVECGRCAKACPYSAIHNFQRPCERACKVDAISMAPGGEASIDETKCVDCGACVYHCPFGATVDVSSIVDVIKLIKNSEKPWGSPVVAIVAPSIGSQFLYANLGQVITGIRKLGFYSVLEVALGADMVAHKEGRELVEKGFLTSSCCPAFVKLIETQFPEMVPHVSHNLSPMAELARFIKSGHPEYKIVFIGPCIAKKAEARKPEIAKYVDYALTFEELQALFDSKGIVLQEQEETEWNQASYYGRIFARAGGLTEAVRQVLKELGEDEFQLNPIACDGLTECKQALARASKGVLPNNFIEGMACVGGCVGGSGNMIKYEQSPRQMKQHIEKATATEIIPNVKKNINIV